MPQKHFRTCTICEAMCGVVLEVEGDDILSLRGDPEDPLSRGHICPKAVALVDIHKDPERLKAPLRRTPNGWKEIGWEEAFAEVAERLKDIQKKFGRHAVAVYQGNPTVHNHGSMLFGQLFVRSLRTRNKFSATSVDQLPHMLAALEMFGHQLLMPVPDIDRTDFFLVLGANPLISNGSIMTAPDIEKRLKALKARGGSLVVIDPRRTETAAMATAHHFIRPGADALFLLAFLCTLFEEGLTRPGRLRAFTDGFDTLREAVLGFPPERVAGAVGIEASTIRQLARDFAAKERAVCYGRVGICTQRFGGLASWLVYAVNVVTGNLDRPGGMMFTTPAFDLVENATRMKQAGHYGVFRSRVRGLPEFGGELPAAVLAEEILTPGQGQIRALVTSAGNPVLSTPNGKKLEEALQTLEFMVSIDIYLNETTRHAHILLPPTFALEHDHYDIAFHLFAIRNTARYCPPVFPKPPNTRHDWEIFWELACRMQEGASPLSRLLSRGKRAVGRLVDPARIIDLGLRFGPYGGGLSPFSSKLSLKKLKQFPHGIDLGPLEPRLPERLNTPKKRIELAPKLFLEDLPRLEQEFFTSPAPSDALFLIGRREMRTNNSWLHNSPRMVKGKERCTLLMHPRDAEARNLTPGERVFVRSRVGVVEVTLETTEDLMPGVVSLPHGWGHDRPGMRISIAATHPGASINDLTDEALVDPLSGNASFSGTPVTVTAARS